MNIFHYEPNTFEYLYTTQADKDPEETRIKGEFVPLVPSCATLKEVPEFNKDNQIPVFENNEWIIKNDYRKNYKKCDDKFNISDINQIGEITDGYLVTNETAQLIQQNPNKFKIENNQIIQKTEEEYKEEQQEKEQERIANLHLTRGDVFRALLQAKNITRSELRTMIEQNTTLDNFQKEMALIDFDEALEFYRGVPLINTIGEALGIENKQLDEFFETGDYTKLCTNLVESENE